VQHPIASEERVMKPDERRGLEERADLLIQIGDQPLIIPKEAFEAPPRGAFVSEKGGRGRCRTGRPESSLSADAASRHRALALGAVANNPTTLGLIGTLMAADAPHAFRGSVFVVVDDARVDVANRRIEAVGYRIAALELSGTTNWSGRATHFALDGPMVGQSGRCCGPSTICVVPPEDGQGHARLITARLTGSASPTSLRGRSSIARGPGGQRFTWMCMVNRRSNNQV
jgi:hypothetical protein